jgi:hypothetical protein
MEMRLLEAFFSLKWEVWSSGLYEGCLGFDLMEWRAVTVVKAQLRDQPQVFILDLYDWRVICDGIDDRYLGKGGGDVVERSTRRCRS